MKKSLIAGAGVAALGMAALPFAGVFAADGTKTRTDTVVVTVDSACSLATSNTSDADYTATIANGAANTAITGSTFTIVCNDTAGWDLNAVGAGTAHSTEIGAGEDDKDVTKMDASTNVDGDDIATADGTPSGSSSSWAFKIASTGDTVGAVSIVEGYTGFKAIPANSTKIAGGASVSGTTAKVTATYGVGISATQSAGTYTGKVTYTLAHPAAS